MSYPYYGAVPSKTGENDRGLRAWLLSPTFIGLICVGVVATGVWMNNEFHTAVVKSVTLSTKASYKAQTTSNIDFTLKRALYSPLPYFENSYTSYLNYEFLKDYDAIIEPYQTMDLHFYGTDLSKGNYVFQVCPENSKENCQEGYSYSSTTGSMTSSKGVKFECSTHSKYDMTLMTVDADGTVLMTQSGKALCLYVRREIRSLHASDLNAYMDASYTLYSTKDEDGKELYGPNFRNNTLLMRYHHYNSAQHDADHIHEGNGFLTQHLKLTNMFDRAVQVVDPSQSLPYWDFTIDAAEGRMPWESVIFTAETYGEMRLPKNKTLGYTYEADLINDGRIHSGRWKDLKVDLNHYYDELDYGYGYLRGPWNMNPSPYITRYAFEFNEKLTLPDCESHYEAFQFDDLMDFFFWNSFAPHSLTHTTFGGFYGCDKFYTLVKQGYVYNEFDARMMCSSWSFKTKEFWRKNYVKARSDCTVKDNVESSFCGFECVEENKDSMITFLFPQYRTYINETDYEGASNAFKEFICGDSGYVFTGDHLESASPGDPSFWVIHPTLERLLHAKLMTGGFETEVWPSNATAEFVCSKSTCYNEEEDNLAHYSDCCYGHFEFDRMMDAEAGDRTSYVGPTNAEVVAMTDPRSKEYSMPYIYDKFEWDHCKEVDGLDFEELLDSLRDEVLNTASSSEDKPHQDVDKKISDSTPVAKKAKRLSKVQQEIKEHKQMLQKMSMDAKKWQEEKSALKKMAAKKQETKSAATTTTTKKSTKNTNKKTSPKV